MSDRLPAAAGTTSGRPASIAVSHPAAAAEASTSGFQPTHRRKDSLPTPTKDELRYWYQRKHYFPRTLYYTPCFQELEQSQHLYKFSARNGTEKKIMLCREIILYMSFQMEFHELFFVKFMEISPFTCFLDDLIYKFIRTTRFLIVAGTQSQWQRPWHTVNRLWTIHRVQRCLRPKDYGEKHSNPCTNSTNINCSVMLK